MRETKGDWEGRRLLGVGGSPGSDTKADVEVISSECSPGGPGVSCLHFSEKRNHCRSFTPTQTG